MIAGFVWCLIVVAVAGEHINTEVTAPKCSVFLTVSLEAKSPEDSVVEINWGPECFEPITWIGLFDKDPSINELHPVYFMKINDTIAGTRRTNTVLGSLGLPDEWNRDRAVQMVGTPLGGRSPVCLPFYVAAFNDVNAIQSIDCLKLQPFWMANISPMWQLPLRDLFIPGTHCSGCFLLDSTTKSSLLHEQIGFSQNFDVWTQLVMGIRHLDLFVGHRQETNTSGIFNNFWVMNENLFMNPLDQILPAIREFVRLTGEMVLVDFREFSPNISNHPERHSDLVQMIRAHLGDHAFGRNNAVGPVNSYELTMRQMREQGRMILVTYNDATIVKENKLLWMPWAQYSTQHLERTEYLEYIRKVIKQQSMVKGFTEIGWSLVAVQSLESAFNSKSFLLSQRERAAEINRNVTAWLSGSWSQIVNVVSMDFVWSTNLIDLAIYTNSQKQPHKFEFRD